MFILRYSQFLQRLEIFLQIRLSAGVPRRDLDTLHVAEEIYHAPGPPGGFAAREEIPSDSRLGMDLLDVVAVEQVAEGLVRGWTCDLRLEKFQHVVCPSIDHGDADIIVRVVTVRRFVLL